MASARGILTRSEMYGMFTVVMRIVGYRFTSRLFTKGTTHSTNGSDCCANSASNRTHPDNNRWNLQAWQSTYIYIKLYWCWNRYCLARCSSWQESLAGVFTANPISIPHRVWYGPGCQL